MRVSGGGGDGFLRQPSKLDCSGIRRHLAGADFGCEVGVPVAVQAGEDVVAATPYRGCRTTFKRVLVAVVAAVFSELHGSFVFDCLVGIEAQSCNDSSTRWRRSTLTHWLGSAAL
jgi:hypothetical protein